MNALRISLVVIGLAGAALFGSLFVASYANPGFVEHLAKQVIRYEVEKKVREKVDRIDTEFLTQRAAHLLKAHSEQIAALQRQLNEGLPQRIAAIIAEMRNLDCECRTNIERSIRGGFEWQIAALSQASDRLNSLIRTKYMETAENLTREFRIFTATNAAVFALLAIAAFVRRRANIHLIPAAIVLLVAAILTAFLYLFSQNWFHTIVFNDYVGAAYFAYLSVAFALLCDVIFNRARVTARLLNWFLNIVGSALSVSPC